VRRAPELRREEEATAAMGSSEAPLLLAHPREGKEDPGADVGDGRCWWWRRCGASSEGWWAEAGRLAAPMIAVALLQLMMQLISTIMVGHLGEVPLAGAAIANSLTNVSGFSVLVSVDSLGQLGCSSFPFFF